MVVTIKNLKEQRCLKWKEYLSLIIVKIAYSKMKPY